MSLNVSRGRQYVALGEGVRVERAEGFSFVLIRAGQTSSRPSAAMLNSRVLPDTEVL